MLTYAMEERGSMKKYEYLYHCIKEDILAGRIPSGWRLPSKRTLAEHLGISVVTVENAYDQLLDEGYLTSRPKSGYFVSELYLPESIGKQDGHVLPPVPGGAGTYPLPHASSGSGAQGTPSFSAGTAADNRMSSAGISSRETLQHRPDMEASPQVSGESRKPEYDFPYTSFLKIVRDVLNDYRDHLLLRPPGAGVPELREAIASYLRRYRGMQVSAGQVIIGSGSEYLYGLIAQFFGQDTVFGVEAESYEKIRLVYASHGVRTELLPMDRKGIRRDALFSSKAEVLHVTPFHSYPTGITASAGKRSEYLGWAEKRGAFIVEDDFESEFSALRKPLETMYAMDRTGSVLYLNTFTKSLAPSMRAGYLVLPERLLEKWHEKLGFYSCTVPSLDQYVLAEYIGRGLFEKRLNHIRRKLRHPSEGKDAAERIN